MTFSKFPISNANSATETIETLSARSIFYPFFVDPLRGTISLGKNGEEEIKVTIRGILIGGVISPGDLSICHRGGGGRGIRDYSSKKYGPRFMGRFRSPFPERDTCIWTNFAGVWSHVRVESRRGPYIIQSFSHRPPPPSRRIAWIPVRGRRVNISPHVKPRAGKNVSTWVPCLVLDAPFAPFLPSLPRSSGQLSLSSQALSFSSPLSIYLPPEGGCLLPCRSPRGGEQPRGGEEETRGERSGTRWMDRSLFLRGV